ncbi:MAG: ECF-type sigma factor [Pseudomonadota bacterium]
MSENPAVTDLLRRWRSGDDTAYTALIEAVYEDVRGIAMRAFVREQPGHTLQATAVANEALLRLHDADVSWEDRNHFLAIIAATTRRILVDHARSRGREKRGGDALHVTLATDHAGAAHPTNVLELHEALETLSRQDARKSKILELHYFAGLTYAEIANLVGVSEATVERDMRFSKAWLRTHLQS